MRGTALPQPRFKHDYGPRVGRRTLLCRRHVSSMTGGCTCPTYYWEVVSVENEGVIILYKLAELIIKDSEAGNRSPAATFQA